MRKNLNPSEPIMHVRRPGTLGVAFTLSILFLSMPFSQGNAQLIVKHYEHVVERNEYGGLIAARFGMDWGHIAHMNGLNPDSGLKAGQVLKIRFARIIPVMHDEGILINIPDRTLYRFSKGQLKDYYFIAAGKTTWQTPLGKFKIQGKAKDPTWHVPASIRKEMEAEGKEVLTKVPPGPDNPLGKYWFQLSLNGIGLHGTNAPQSIYKFASHGCMRLKPEDAEYLFSDISVGTTGEIVYSPVKMFRTAEGRVLVEIYRDFYRRGINYSRQIEELLALWNAHDIIDRQKLDKALFLKSGVVTDITR